MFPAKNILRFLVAPIAILLTTPFASGSKRDVIKASHHDTSPPLAQLAAQSTLSTGGSNGQKATARATGALLTSSKVDPVAAPFAGPLTGVTSLLNFDGQSAADNRDLFGFAFVPPDTNGAVGATQFVQMVNVTVAVYEKATGSLQLGPAPIALGHD